MDSSLRNVVLLGLAFALIFSAFNTQGFIEIKVLDNYANASISSGISPHSGYYGFSILYAVFTFSNFLAPPLVGLLGAKWAMVLGACCYCLFLLSFLHLTALTFYLASALVGFGAAVLWTGQGSYLTANSSSATIARNSGILWGLFQTCFITGGFFLYFVLKGSTVGLDDVHTMRMMYSVFSGVCAVGILTLIALPSGSRRDVRGEREHEDTDALIESIENGNAEIVDGVSSETESIPPTARDWTHEFGANPCPFSISLAVSTFRLLLTRDMLFLSVVFMYSGLEMTFFTGVFSTCIASTTAFHDDNDVLLAYNAFALGFGQISGGLAFGVFSYRTVRAGRNPIVLLGTVSHILAFFLIFLFIPSEAPLRETAKVAWIDPNTPLALLCGVLLGFADSCWNTQIYSLLGQVYAKNSSSAFALYKFFQSLAACASFFYGSVLVLHWQLLILAVSAGVSAICFFPVEWKAAGENAKRA